MLKNYLVIFAFFFNPLCNYGQRITGQIQNKYGEKISFASVMIKDSATAFTVNEFTIARNGQFDIDLKRTYRHLVVEVSANHYYNSVFNIREVQKEQIYHHDFILTLDTILKLQDVVIKAKPLRTQVRGDTVKYNVAAFRDGTERKIQDIIKKLPGIDVNEKTGEIKYKGKSVETVKLDGDDLFGSNYMIGTKNINVGIVEQVQAIEHYSDNPLLKGLENGDKVALNLTLKKMKTDYSGNGEVGFGLNDRGALKMDLGTNLLAISKKIKSFSTLSYNNIGMNNSPLDYFSYVPNIDEYREAGYLAKKVIAESFSDLNLEEERSNNNSSMFGSYNAILKIHPKLSTKLNLYYLKDKLFSQQSEFSRVKIDSGEILTSDLNQIEKSPKQLRADVEVKWNASSTSLIEYRFKIRNENISTSANILQNQATHYDTRLLSRDYLVKQSLLYTKRLTNKRALQISLNQALNDVPQRYFLLPAVVDALTYEENQQQSHFKKNVADVEATILGNANRFKYICSIGAKTDGMNFYSDLTGTTSRGTVPIDSFENHSFYSKLNFYQSTSFSFRFGKWRFTPSNMATYLVQDLKNMDERTRQKLNRIVFEPALTAGVRLNKVSSIVGVASYANKPFSEEYLFSSPVLISSRMSRKNVVNLKLQQTFSSAINYSYNDFARQLQVSMGANYRKNKGDYFSALQIDPVKIYTSFFYLPEGSSGLGGYLSSEKYVSSLQSTIRVKSDFSISTYKNVINNSQIRKNNIHTLNTELFFKTAYDKAFNFENIVTIKTLKTGNEMTPYKNSEFRESFKLIYKPGKNLLTWVSNYFFVPNTKTMKLNYLFIDATLKVSTKDKKTDLRVIAKNILNKRVYQAYTFNDYSSTTSSTEILPGYLMISASRNF